MSESSKYPNSRKYFSLLRMTSAVIALLLCVCPLMACSAGPVNLHREQYYVSVADLHESRVDVAESPRVEGQLAGQGDPRSIILVRRPPVSSGPLDGEAAGRVIYARSDELGNCYLRQGGETRGRGVVFAILDVEPNGEVSHALIGHSDVRDSRFAQCLSRSLRAMSMPPSAGRSVLQTYFVFGARDENDGRRMLRAYRAASASTHDDDDEASPLTEVRRTVQGCYERIIRNHESLVGRMVLGLTLQENGRVSKVEISEENLDGRLDTCVVAAVQNLRLHIEGEENSTLVYPIVMYPGQEVLE